MFYHLNTTPGFVVYLGSYSFYAMWRYLTKTAVCRLSDASSSSVSAQCLQFLIDIDILVNCNWVVTRWQWYSTHLHPNNTQNDTKQTIHRTAQQFGRVRAVPRLCKLYPGICLTAEEKAWKNPSQGSRV